MLFFLNVKQEGSAYHLFAYSWSFINTGHVTNCMYVWHSTLGSSETPMEKENKTSSPSGICLLYFFYILCHPEYHGNHMWL